MGLDTAPGRPRSGQPSERPKAGATDAETHIGRRAFIGLMVAGLAGLFLGKDLFSWLSDGAKSVSQNFGFRINSVAPGPEFDEATWRLTVDGLVRKPLKLSFKEFTDLPQAEWTRDFYCVEGWGVDDVEWKGVTVREIMERSDIDPLATHLVFHSGDGIYTDSVTIEEALRNDTLLAHRLNGEPLPEDLGRPVRLVLPGTYGYKYVKWVVRVEAIAAGPEGYRGYWEERGYPADATIR